VAKDDVFVQCDLRRVNGQVDVSWIPERYAQRGKMLKLKNVEGVWENGWEVVALHTRRRFDELELKERDYLHQREASDV
jgi:hypothetical protein